MKYFIFTLALVISFFGSFSQTPFNRSSAAVTAVDARLRAALNLGVPITSDTTLNGGLDSLGMLIFVKPISSFYIRDTNFLGGGHKWSKILKEGDIPSASVFTDTTINGNGTLGDPLSVDTSVVASYRALQDTARLLLNNQILIGRISFIQGAASATYQNDTLIGKNITSLEIQGYSVGFLQRPNSVYISSFDSSTGVITLTNGVFEAGDFVRILFRTPPIFLLDANGWPIKDSNGNYIILN